MQVKQEEGTGEGSGIGEGEGDGRRRAMRDAMVLAREGEGLIENLQGEPILSVESITLKACR